MATVTLGGSVTWNTTGGDTTVTTTPAVDELIVVVAASSGLAGGTTAVSDNQGGTYVQVDSDRTGFSTTGVLTVWVRTALIPAGDFDHLHGVPGLVHGWGSSCPAGHGDGERRGSGGALQRRSVNGDAGHDPRPGSEPDPTRAEPHHLGGLQRGHCGLDDRSVFTGLR